MEIRFYLKDGKVVYDDIEKGISDSYYNNSCVGTWRSYRSKSEKKCNWGEYRIPGCGDLDIGAGEFSPNPKYFKYGWELYNRAYIGQCREAKKEIESK